MARLLPVLLSFLLLGVSSVHAMLREEAREKGFEVLLHQGIPQSVDTTGAALDPARPVPTGYPNSSQDPSYNEALPHLRPVDIDELRRSTEAFTRRWQEQEDARSRSSNAGVHTDHDIPEIDRNYTPTTPATPLTDSVIAARRAAALGASGGGATGTGRLPVFKSEYLGNPEISGEFSIPGTDDTILIVNGMATSNLRGSEGFTSGAVPLDSRDSPYVAGASIYNDNAAMNEAARQEAIKRNLLSLLVTVLVVGGVGGAVYYGNQKWRERQDFSLPLSDEFSVSASPLKPPSLLSEQETLRHVYTHGPGSPGETARSVASSYAQAFGISHGGLNAEARFRGLLTMRAHTLLSHGYTPAFSDDDIREAAEWSRECLATMALALVWMEWPQTHRHLFNEMQVFRLVTEVIHREVGRTAPSAPRVPLETLRSRGVELLKSGRPALDQVPMWAPLS